MGKQPPGDSPKKGVARRDRDEGPTHEMSTHPEFGGDDEVEDATDQAVIPEELLKKPGFSGDTRIELNPPGARPDPRPGPGGDARAGFSGDTQVEPAPPSRESSKERRAARDPKDARQPREPSKEPKGGFEGDTRIEPAPAPRPERAEEEPREQQPGFAGDTRIEPAPSSRPGPAEKEPLEASAPKGYFERTDPAARPEPPVPAEEDALPWESGERPFGATIPLPDVRDQLPPETPFEPEPAPAPKDPPKRSATREGLRRAASPEAPSAEAPPKKATKPTRDAVPISVANQETNVKAAPTSRDVAGQETRIKAAPTAEERSSNPSRLAHQETTIKPAPEERRHRTGAQPAVRGDFPEPEPRHGGGVANASTVLKPIPEDVRQDLGVERPRKATAAAMANASTALKPIPEDVQQDLGAERPARRPGARDAGRRPAPLDRPDPTPIHEVEVGPERQEQEEEEEPPPPKPKPLPFVDKRLRHASSADGFDGDAPGSGARPGGLRSARRANPRVSKVFQTLSHLKSMSEGNPKGLAIVGGAFALIVIVVIVVGAVRGGDRPRLDELRRAYPFGYGGARGPRGEQAPGAAELTFTFKMIAPCPQTAEPECLLYEYSKGNFQGRMLLRKTSDGWVRASDEGAPFLIVK